MVNTRIIESGGILSSRRGAMIKSHSWYNIHIVDLLVKSCKCYNCQDLL